jgi:hypothetical protein
MAVHGALAEHELGGDRLVGLAGGNQPQHLQLTLREAMGITARAARERANPHEVEPRRHLRVGRVRGFQLEAAVSPSPRARQARPTSSRTRAAS